MPTWLENLTLENRFHAILLLNAILFLAMVGLITIVLIFRTWIRHNARQRYTDDVREKTTLTDAWQAAGSRLTHNSTDSTDLSPPTDPDDPDFESDREIDPDPDSDFDPDHDDRPY